MGVMVLGRFDSAAPTNHKTIETMTLKEAKKYIKFYCECGDVSEIHSWAVEGTISTKQALALKDAETIINLAEDLQYQVKCEVGWYFSAN